ncbi:hypothetical protein M432DRAFT_151652 [Thermoascus aurantiacus ATCC 26904]
MLELPAGRTPPSARCQETVSAAFFVLLEYFLCWLLPADIVPVCLAIVCQIRGARRGRRQCGGPETSRSAAQLPLMCRHGDGGRVARGQPRE